MISATILTGFNDNAAITYLASLVPNFSAELKYAVMAGAVTGGGLTVIANAPNPVGQSILGQEFGEGGISPLGSIRCRINSYIDSRRLLHVASVDSHVDNADLFGSKRASMIDDSERVAKSDKRRNA